MPTTFASATAAALPRTDREDRAASSRIVGGELILLHLPAGAEAGVQTRSDRSRTRPPRRAQTCARPLREFPPSPTRLCATPGGLVPRPSYGFTTPARRAVTSLRRLDLSLPRATE